MGKWHYEVFQTPACKGMDNILEVKKILGSNTDIKLIIKFFNASVLNILLYATKTNMIDAALQNKINAFQMQCLRTILSISRDNHVRNEYIYKQTNT